MNAPTTFTPLTTEADPRWARILARDPAADGQFWYSVATTGVYCRPSCPSRAANPKNVTIHDTLAAARATGCRPCKRCHPDGSSSRAQNAALVERACRRLEDGESLPLAALAEEAELSPAYFHRLFRAHTGLTPRAYAAHRRGEKVRANLKAGAPVTRAFYDAGFNSGGRFYAQASDLLGMAPARFRAGGPEETLRFAVGQSALGAVLVAASAKGVAAILLGDDPAALVREVQDLFPKAEFVGGDAGFEALVARVVGFVEQPRLGLDLPLDVRGAAFRQRVWQALRQVGPGETVSYAEIARRIGAPKAMRAVAGACAANRLAVAIPCHRVVRQDGALGGYRWGVERKRALIAAEAAA
jgi:AraC family transcriptional regulator of adaptative response/methylated-DNA-[protein]-cysteine methyltransferase